MKERTVLGAVMCRMVSSCVSAPKKPGWILGGEFPEVKVIVEDTKSYDDQSAASIFADCLGALDDLGVAPWDQNKDLWRIQATLTVRKTESIFSEAGSRLAGPL